MKYRKKPVIVEAYQTDKEMIIHTLEGDMKASIGDYIITGVNGEQYPCKPDIFFKTYENVDETDSVYEMKLKDLLEISKCVIIALDGKDGKTLFDSRNNTPTYIKRFKNGKVLDIWVEGRSRHDFYDTITPVLMVYLSHNSWLEMEAGEND